MSIPALANSIFNPFSKQFILAFSEEKEIVATYNSIYSFSGECLFIDTMKTISLNQPLIEAIESSEKMVRLFRKRPSKNYYGVAKLKKIMDANQISFFLDRALESYCICDFDREKNILYTYNQAYNEEGRLIASLDVSPPSTLEEAFQRSQALNNIIISTPKLQFGDVARRNAIEFDFESLIGLAAVDLEHLFDHFERFGGVSHFLLVTGKFANLDDNSVQALIRKTGSKQRVIEESVFQASKFISNLLGLKKNVFHQ